MFIVDTIQDIRDMARGAVLLGTGGGGDPYIGELFVTAQIKRAITRRSSHATRSRTRLSSSRWPVSARRR